MVGAAIVSGGGDRRQRSSGMARNSRRRRNRRAQPAPGQPTPAQLAAANPQVTKGEFTGSTVYPGTWREYWVYIPKQLDRTKPAPVMVFQDGLQYNAPNVFDDLIAKKAIPPLVGVFVMHGRVKALSDGALDRMNRSFEYDAVSGDYAKFLLDELLPFVAKTHNLNLSNDPNDRAIAGNSSGAIAAFVAAWQRPDAFRRVFSAIGTYVGLRGGNEFPVLIRKTEPKPIRVFLEDGRNDQNNYTGNWFIANQDMLSAFEYAGYDVRHVWGDGEHNSRHATEVFPEAVTWLWSGYPAPIKANAGRQVEAGRLSGARARRRVDAGERRPSRHRRSGGERQGRDVLQRSVQQQDLPHRPRRQGERVRRKHQPRQRHDVRPRRQALRRRHARPSSW